MSSKYFDMHNEHSRTIIHSTVITYYVNLVLHYGHDRTITLTLPGAARGVQGRGRDNSAPKT